MSSVRSPKPFSQNTEENSDYVSLFERDAPLDSLVSKDGVKEFST